MSIPAVESSGFVPLVAPQLPVAAPTQATKVTELGGTEGPGGEFASMLADGIERMEGLNDRADHLAVQAATGDLSNLHDYTIAATEAAVTTQLTAAVRNKALEAFNEIMRMPV